MGIAEWFKPRWKSPDAQKRMEAVTGLDAVKHRERLIQLASGDKAASVRQAALEKLDLNKDHETIAAIAFTDESPAVRQSAINLLDPEKNNAILLKIIEEDKDNDIRQSVLEKIAANTSQAAIANIALSNSHDQIRLQALALLDPKEHQDTFSVMFKNDQAAEMRLAAWAKIEPEIRIETICRTGNVSILEEVARRDTESRVRKAALGRIKDSELLATLLCDENDTDLVLEAMERISEPEHLLRIMRSGTEMNVQLAAVSGITAQKTLFDIAVTAHPFPARVRLEAIKKISDDRLLHDLLNTSPDEDLINKVIGRINDQHILFQVLCSDQSFFSNKMTAASALTDQQMIKSALEKNTDPDILHCLIGKLPRVTLDEEGFLHSLFNKHKELYTLSKTRSERKKNENIMVRIAELTEDEDLLFEFARIAGNYAARAAFKKIRNAKLIFKAVLEIKNPIIKRMAVRKLDKQIIFEHIALNRRRNFHATVMEKVKGKEIYALIFDHSGHTWDETELKRMALESPFQKVRKKALLEITDQDVLSKAARHDPSDDIREYAIDKITNESSLCELVIAETQGVKHNKAIFSISRRELLTEIAGNAKKPENRVKAMERIDNDDILLDLFENEAENWMKQKIYSRMKNPTIRLKAARIENDKVKSMLADVETDKRVRQIIIAGIKELLLRKKYQHQFNKDQEANHQCSKCGSQFYLNKNDKNAFSFITCLYAIHDGSILCYGCLRELGHRVCARCGDQLPDIAVTALLPFFEEKAHRELCDLCESDETQKQQKAAMKASGDTFNGFGLAVNNNLGFGLKGLFSCPKCGRPFVDGPTGGTCSCGYWVHRSPMSP